MSKFESSSSTKDYSILLMFFVLPALDFTSITLIYFLIAQYEPVAFLEILYFKISAFFNEVSAATLLSISDSLQKNKRQIYVRF